MLYGKRCDFLMKQTQRSFRCDSAQTSIPIFLKNVYLIFEELSSIVQEKIKV